MDPINWHSVFFLLLALAACWLAVAVVVSGNIVRMAFYLVVCLGAVAGLFLLAGADFVGAMQLMIYVGGTMVLLVFGVMLTGRGPAATFQTSRGQLLAAAAVGGLLLGVLLLAALGVGPGAANAEAARPPGRGGQSPPTAARLGLGLLGIRVDRLGQQDETLREGMSGYLLPFEIVSVHLLVVLIGAAYLARAKRPAARRSPPP